MDKNIFGQKYTPESNVKLIVVDRND